MSELTLKEQLQQLHDELKASPELDVETLDLLTKVADDINQLSGKSSDYSDITDTIQEQAIRFDQDHPALSTALRQIIDTLGRIGV